jgi:hypothetical protein
VSSNDKKLKDELLMAKRDKQPPNKGITLDQYKIARALVKLPLKVGASPCDFDEETIQVSDVLGRIFELTLSIKRFKTSPKKAQNSANCWSIKQSNCVIGYCPDRNILEKRHCVALHHS